MGQSWITVLGNPSKGKINITLNHFDFVHLIMMSFFSRTLKIIHKHCKQKLVLPGKEITCDVNLFLLCVCI